MSDRKVSIVGTQGYAENAHSVRFVLPFFVQPEIRVRLQNEALFVAKSYGEVASGSVEAAGTTLLRAIGDSCPIAK